MSAKAQKPQEYFVYFKVFVTLADKKFAAGRVRGFIQCILNDYLLEFIDCRGELHDLLS